MVKALFVAVLLAAQAAAPIFRFETDGFWLNLHHYLYVLGRVEAKMPDIQRDAVAGAPADEAEGLAVLSEAERQAWREAVSFYAGGLSRQDAVFDRSLIGVTNTLRRAPSGGAASALAIDRPLAAVLDKAAPLYRRAWWPRHRAANRAWLASMQEPLTKYGSRMLADITGAYQETWVNGGYPVNVSAFSSWAGAYSTSSSLLVVSSLSDGNQGLMGFEITFHEAMHQWDDAILARLRKAAAAHSMGQIPGQLTHAMIFYTTGAAMRRIVPGHAPYADVAGIWKGRMGAFKPSLDAHWKPYLDGQTSLDEALLALLKGVRP